MKFPLGIQTFSEIRQDGYQYVDKTALIHTLISSGKVYFFSRPRRFGKSLLVSTLSSLFSGDKALFEGLDISHSDYDFAVHPVIKMEFAKDEYDTADNLRSYIEGALNDIAAGYGISLQKPTYNQRFDELVAKLHEQTGKKVVLLIDEYDKPILNNLDNPVLPEIKKVMNAFYAVAKSLDEHLRFVFITGVSKFAKVSVFSGMNNLTDISMDKRYADLCGVTQQELERDFASAIDELAAMEGQKTAAMLTKIKHWYNGYRFEEDADTVYNPYSLLSLFSKQKFSNYWFTTATPTFLLKLLRDKQFELNKLSEFAVGEAAFAASEPEQMNELSVLFQTGYLTLKSCKGPLFVLDFPNHEVKKSFFDSVVDYYGHISTGMGQSYVWQLSEHLNKDDMATFFETLEVFFANIPYDITLNQEKYYQSMFYAIFTLLGMTIEAEVRTNKGRIDCVLQTDERIYIIEFKLDGSKEEAMAQIHDKQYAQKYQGSNKQMVLLGVAFDQKSRNIAGYLEQQIG